MIGNFAIARGLVEAGVEMAAAYPGTPSSEILPGIIEFKGREKKEIYVEWSVNERCAFEAAFGAAMAGKKAVCIMKQVGLNVAFPPFLAGKDMALNGALVIISCDDPGPQSSQTEQDTRLIATLLSVPVIDPASPVEACDAAFHALKLSWRTKRPVILRSTHRVSHAREAVQLLSPGSRTARLHDGVKLKGGRALGIVASGMSSNVALDVIAELGLQRTVSLYKAVTIFPVSRTLLAFIDAMEKVLVLEETDEVLEAFIGKENKVYGRRNGYVPRAGELTYNVIRGVIGRVAEETGMGEGVFSPDRAIEEAVSTVRFPQRPPKLCAGCPHRASFWAMRHACPEAIFSGDIGCYTLGISMGAVDTCLDMGGSVGLAGGFANAFQQDGAFVPIIATVGDSTFFHATLPLLYDAARKGKRFVLVILDNGTTAMTGMQPTPQSGLRADGPAGRRIAITDVVKSFGIGFLKVLDPYDMPLVSATVGEAVDYLKKGGKGPAVIIAARECLLFAKGKGRQVSMRVNLEKDCVGCKACLELFDCPAFFFDEKEGKVKADENLCVGCGTCLFVCPMKRQGKSTFSFQESYFIKHPLG